jgi:flagellar hook-length control protein FliK
VPALKTAMPVPDVTASTETGPSAGQEVTAAETVSPMIAGAAAGTVESRAVRAATREVAADRTAAQTTASAAGRDVPLSVNLQAGASAFESDLATVASNNAPAGSERSALAMSRLESALTMAQPLTPMQPSAHSPAAPTPTPAQATIPLPLHHPNWQDAFAARVAWQVRDGLQQVSLAITPPELGPVEVRMSINDDRVSAQFITPHHVVRQVIEDAMPRLRDMLSQSGLNLADANVFHHAPGRDGQAQTFAGRSGDPSAVNGPSIAEDVSPRSVRVAHVGLIDAYV